jgi:Flp pilus assembly protein TadG
VAALILARFARNCAGTIAPIFGLMAIPLVVAMGGVVDYTNAYDQKTVVQDAMDSAALAAGKKIGTMTMSQLEQEVDNYYYTNVGTRMSTPPPLEVTLETQTITLETDLSVPTYFLGLIGLNYINFHLTSQATLSVSTLEVALVLDNSGSMLTNNNIAALRTASANLVDILYNLGAQSSQPDPVKVSLVPFAGAVNIGAQFRNDASATWLDKTGAATYTADAIDGTATTANPFTLFDSMNGVSWGGCTEMRPMPYDVNDDEGDVDDPNTLFAPMFAADEPDTWTCAGSMPSGCTRAGSSSSNYRYNGAPAGTRTFNNYLADAGTPSTCGATINANAVTFTLASPGTVNQTSHRLVANDRVMFSTSGALPTGLNSTTQYYVLSTGLTANSFRVSTSQGGSAINFSGSQSGTHRLLGSSAWNCGTGNSGCGGTSNGYSDAAVMARTCKYGTPTNKSTPSAITVYTTELGAGGPNFMCTTNPIIPLTTNETQVTNAVNAMPAVGSTNIQEGLMWGWRVLSPTAPFTEGRAYSNNTNLKIVILMTDGDNTYFPIQYSGRTLLNSWYGAWGFIAKQHAGINTTNQATFVSKMNERTAIACTNAKAAGLRIYSVAFTGSGGVNQTTQDMLRDCATEPSMFYLAADQQALYDSFVAIGNQISLLRISQ